MCDGRDKVCGGRGRAGGGRHNVCSAQSQRGGKMTKSATATPASWDGQVSTVKMDGSGWSAVTVFTAWKRARSYLYGV